MGVISPLLSNLHLTEVDRMLEKATETTRSGKYTYVQYARFADDLVILIDSYPRHDWLVKAVGRRPYKRTELFAKLREIFRQNVSQPVGKVIERINPALRGWVNYFRIGDSHRCFSMVEYWVEGKIRRHLMRARGRKGMGWKQWSKEWIYGTLGLFNDYRVGRQLLPKAAPASYVT
jgi:RNA-directed DNA polymerase